MNTKQSVRQYGCVKCQTTHTEPDPLFQEHIIHQSKHGWKWVAVEPRRNQPANNTKHTPGPWRLMNSSKAGFLNVYTTHQTGELEATDFICEIGPGARNEGEINANARLIAAAPELLEACKAVSRLDYLQEHNALAAQVKAAIQKAEGTV